MTEHIVENITTEVAEIAFTYDSSGVVVGIVTGISLSLFILSLLYSLMTSLAHKNKNNFKWFYIMLSSLLFNVIIWFWVLIALVDIEGSQLISILEKIGPFLGPVYYLASFLAAAAAVIGIKKLIPLLNE